LENIVVDKDFNVRIIDFGSASQIRDEKNNRISFKEGVGTKDYRAPELNENRNYTADKIDIFTLGVILYSMLKGRPPFFCASKVDKYYKHIAAEDYGTFWGNSEDISDSAKTLINSMLCYKSANRLSMDELINSGFYRGEVETIENMTRFFRCIQCRY
jgi:serine/threonine protein kinase